MLVACDTSPWRSRLAFERNANDNPFSQSYRFSIALNSATEVGQVSVIMPDEAVASDVQNDVLTVGVV